LTETSRVNILERLHIAPNDRELHHRPVRGGWRRHDAQDDLHRV